MQKITCSQLKIDLAQIKDLKNEFDLEVEKIIQTRNTEHALAIQKKIEEKLTATEKIFPKEIKAIFTNPETNEQKEIVFNIKEKIKEAQEFYKNHNLPIPNEQEIKKIFRGSKAEIQKEIAMYGYDNILIVPEGLNAMMLKASMTEGYNKTWQSSEFKNGAADGFQVAKTTEIARTRIILCHSDENIYKNDDANPFNKATLDKSILQLSGLTREEIDRRVENNEEVPVSFEAVINGKKTQIKSEGFSLNEYLIFQRQYFEKTNKHLDSNGWTWLPKTRSGSRFVYSRWDPGVDQLSVYAGGAGYSGGRLGCRLSRSFST